MAISTKLNHSAKVMGDEQIHELLENVKKNISIDCSLRENARAKILVIVKHILRNYSYPPDFQRVTTELIFE